MKLSNRITNITGTGSDGWDLFYKARAMKAAGADVTELTIGEHDIRTDPVILDHMAAAARGGHTGYAIVPGIPALRDAVAARVSAQTGVPTTRDNVVITAGGQAALFAAHMAACDPGDRAVFLDPYYATYPGTIRAAGAVPVPVACAPEDGFQPRLEALASAVKGARSLLVNSPNNPTGAVYTRASVEAIAEVTRTQDLWVISDEVYDTQIWSGAHISPRALPEMVERTMVVGSMSKSHAMTGSRVGWLIAPQDAVEKVIDLVTNTNYGVCGYIQDAALFALGLGHAFEDKIAEPFRRRRDLVQKIVAQHGSVGIIPADGAMYVMLDIRATGLSGEGFAEKLLDTHHIAVMPGESFGQAAAGHLRVALTVADDLLETSVTTLCTLADDLARKGP